ncbi:DNA-binding protein [Thalassobacillus devorans]|uniref:DNA-binding protein n=1 Tax=Thalassobacillus devorans TaxID=279813 RepID=A0ABQ1NM17_9BACI|nr:RsfA family transcriptional regulator [Thalassobacillus devorans]NIK27800.1 RsfA family transcription factor [Thalassobacillus devorans]GGC80537.1 DNA-binding protein [Thalassobacillus devorans]
MDVNRQDAWKENEDLLLAETVLRCIRQGRTQLEAFREVADKLSRTPAACGFRWNANVRKHYQQAIETAKNERKRKQHAKAAFPDAALNMSLDDAISLLTEMKEKQNSAGDPKVQEQVKTLREENQALKDAVTRYQSAWKEVEKLMDWVQKDKNLPV